MSRQTPTQIMTMQRQTWTFSSSGWLFTYFFGVIKALREENALENRCVRSARSQNKQTESTMPIACIQTPFSCWKVLLALEITCDSGKVKALGQPNTTVVVSGAIHIPNTVVH